MHVVVEVALPVFALIFVGWLAGRTGLLGQDSSVSLNRFVYYFALPAVLFLAMARRPIHEVLNVAFIGAYLGSMLLVYALGWLIGMALRRETQETHSMQALNACFSNSGYMGIPLFLAAFGADRMLPALIATVIMGAVMVPVGVVAIELVGRARHGLGRALADVGKALARNPLVIASLAGLIWTALNIPVPKPLATFCELLGAAAGPGALFAIGLFLAGRPLTVDWREVSWLVALKLLVHPALAWWLMWLWFPMDPYWTAATMLLAALPTGALTFVVASQYGAYVERTSQAILISTILSVPTLSALLWVFVGDGVGP
ncbi:MAG: AEC family transporter [Alphaproteobacteria bacterium]|nr:AEC family transporter [Alphaproteobacteria bacterium]